MSRLLDAEGLALIRGGRLLFEGLSFSLEGGQALQLTGPNGSGKTSLIRLIAGLLQPNAGRIEHAPVALADDKLALDCEQRLGRALAFWGGPALDQSIEAFGLAPLSQIPVRLLSAGQAKRAQLALVMARGAPLWLLDEPLNGLDGRGILELERAIDRHRAAGGAIVAASHLPMNGEWAQLELAL